MERLNHVEPIRLPREPAETSPERLVTIAAAATAVGAHVWALRRAIKRGEIPYYQPFNSRKLVKVSEVVAVIDSTKVGGVL